MFNLILGFLWFHHQISKSNTLGHPLRCKPQPFLKIYNFWASAYSISPSLVFKTNGLITVFSGPLIGVRPKPFFFFGQNELIESWGILCVLDPFLNPKRYNHRFQLGLSLSVCPTTFLFFIISNYFGHLPWCKSHSSFFFFHLIR